MENNNEKGMVHVDVPADLDQGVYANLAIISHTPTEFVLDFASLMPSSKNGKVRSRVIMAPEHAKRLMMAMQENVMRYEQQYGTIRLRNGKKTDISPFGMNGDA